MLPQKAKHLDKRPAPEEGAWGRKAVRQVVHVLHQLAAKDADDILISPLLWISLTGALASWQQSSLRPPWQSDCP
jgi:hypothetical protein